LRFGPAVRRKAYALGAAIIFVAAALCCVNSARAAQTTASPSAAQSSPQPTKKAKSSAHKKSRKTAASRKRGQQKIDAQRALQIQQALIREHYMTGTPSGAWDTTTQSAMQKYQADNGWQSKTTPDARALIKLGLGPDQQHLLNPESAMTAQPLPPNHPTSSPTADPPANQPQK